MQEIIQNITFPQNDMLEEHSKLYYRGAEGVLLHENEKKYLVLPAFQQTEFSTLSDIRGKVYIEVICI